MLSIRNTVWDQCSLSLLFVFQRCATLSSMLASFFFFAFFPTDFQAKETLLAVYQTYKLWFNLQTYSFINRLKYNVGCMLNTCICRLLYIALWNVINSTLHMTVSLNNCCCQWFSSRDLSTCLYIIIKSAIWNESLRLVIRKYCFILKFGGLELNFCCLHVGLACLWRSRGAQDCEGCSLGYGPTWFSRRCYISKGIAREFQGT